MFVPSQKLFRGASLAAFLLSLCVAANAQETTVDASEADAESGEVVEEIVVKGFRGSLMRAIDRKRMSDEMIDAVSAEDIGQLASENVGDAIFGVAGVDIDFDNGEADSIIVGGLGAEYNKVTIDGVSVGSVQESGAQSIAGFSTSMVAGVDVIKSPSAKQTEGALGGVINLRPWKPLNFRETRVNISTSLGYQEKTGKNDGKINVLVGGRNDSRTLGFVLGGSSEKRDFRTDTFAAANGAVWVYRLDGASSTARGPAEDLALMLRSVEFRQNLIEHQRDNVFATLQFAPRDNLDFSIGGSFAKIARDRDQTQTSAKFNQNIWYDEDQLVRAPASWTPESRVNERILGGVWLASDDVDVLDAGSFLRWQAYRYYKTDETKIGTFEMNWDPSEDLQIRLRATYSNKTGGSKAGDGGHTTYDQRANLVFGMDNGSGLPFYEVLNDDAAIVDATFKNNGSLKKLISVDWNDALYPDFDPANPGTWTDALAAGGARDPAEFYANGATPGNKSNEVTGKHLSLDMTYRLRGDIIKSMNFGVRTANSDFLYQNTSGLGPPNAWFKGKYYLSDVGIARTIGDDFLSGDAQGWDVPDWNAGMDTLYNGGAGSWVGTNVDGPQTFFRPDQFYMGETDTLAGYLQFNFRSERWVGNVGLRYVEDDFVAVSPRRTPGGGLPSTPWQRTDANGVVDDSLNNANTYGAYWNHDFADDLMDLANYQDRTGGLEETHFLPSLNARFELNDDMYLRFAASKTMARQPYAPRRANTWFRPAGDDTPDDTADDTYILSGGNPQMKATLSNNLAVAFEWYIGDASIVSLSYLRKDLKNVRSVLRKDLVGVDFVDPVTGELFEDIDISERRADGNGFGSLYNIELGLVQSLHWMPGRLFDNMGFSFNYTYSERDVVKPTDTGFEPLSGPPAHSMNGQLYYQGERVTMRLAHFWREQRISSLVPTNLRSAEKWQDVRENTTFTARYDISDRFAVSLRVQNLLDFRPRMYGAGYPDMITNLNEAGRRYLLALDYRL